MLATLANWPKANVGTAEGLLFTGRCYEDAVRTWHGHCRVCRQKVAVTGRKVRKQGQNLDEPRLP